MTSPISGVWELVSDVEEGLLILTETHFTDVTVKKDREAWPVPLDRAAVTDEMRAEAWKGLLFALGGTYEVVSSDGPEVELLFHPSVTHLPLPARDISHKIHFDGNTMSGDMGPRHEVWRRVASVT